VKTKITISKRPKDRLQ